MAVAADFDSGEHENSGAVVYTLFAGTASSKYLLPIALTMDILLL